MLKDYINKLLQICLPKYALTVLAGLLANNCNPNIKNFLIRRFIKTYAVNMNEALEENPLAYPCFNDFFIRHLKPTCRSLAQADILSPVDGIISELGRINKDQILQAKGRWYTVNDLLACDPQINERFYDGSFATLYLSPKDYHRVHMPINAELEHMLYIPGRLFSVQPSAVRVIPYLFARNERLISIFKTERGLMAMILVGATIVGSISTRWEGELRRSSKKKWFNYQNTEKNKIQQGEEMGYFKLGSTVILLFENTIKLDWLKSLHPGKRIQFGEALGNFY